MSITIHYLIISFCLQRSKRCEDKHYNLIAHCCISRDKHRAGWNKWWTQKWMDKWMNGWMVGWIYLYENTLGLKSEFGLPWWHSGSESTYQCRGYGFDPWSGKIPHAMEQLSPCTTITEVTCSRAHKLQLLNLCLESVVHNKRSLHKKPTTPEAWCSSAPQTCLFLGYSNERLGETFLKKP